MTNFSIDNILDEGYKTLYDIKVLEEEITKFQRRQEKLKTEIKRNTLIISIENKLNKLPTRGIGSISLYNILNQKFDFFENEQFNKLIRFLSFLEIKESEYSKYINNLLKNYHSSPNRSKIIVLEKMYEELNSYYELLLLCCDAVENDKVSFNKIFNLLEDKGYFLTVHEKNKLEHLKSISTGLVNVLNSIEELNRDTQAKLGEIASNQMDMDYKLWDISWDLKNSL